MTATSDAKLQTISWKVGGMDCAGCAAPPSACPARRLRLNANRAA